MATLTDITTGAQTVTATGAVTATAGLDVSGITGDFTIVVDVQSLTTGKTARIQIEDSANAWTASAALAVVDITGKVDSTNAASMRYSWRKYQLPNNQFGQTGGVVRVNVTALDGSSSLKLHAWVEQ